jgi:transposase
LDPDRLIFIDETWATTNMARRYGRSPRGQRLVAAVPHGHWKTSTFVAGLRTRGLTAPLVIDGAMNGATFLAYVEQMLAPTLSPGDIVIMDNLASHKVAGVREAIEGRGARLVYLPPYSPDLNPIEQAFAKLKRSCERSPLGPYPNYGMPWANCSTASRPRNAQIISPTPDMFHSIGIRSNPRSRAP